MKTPTSGTGTGAAPAATLSVIATTRVWMIVKSLSIFLAAGRFSCGIHIDTTRSAINTTGLTRRPRARGRALGRVVSVAVSAVGVADRGGASAGTVFVTARSRGRLMSGQQKQKKGHHHERRSAASSREVLGHESYCRARR